MRKTLYMWLIAAVLVVVSTLPLYGLAGGRQRGVEPIVASQDTQLLRKAIEKALPEKERPDRMARAGEEFADTMVPFTAALLPVSREIAVISRDPALAAIAKRISQAEQARLAEFRRWQRGEQSDPAGLAGTSAVSFHRLMDEVADDTRDLMQSALLDPNPDVCFVAAMIAQGEGAIDMAKVVLIFEGNDELRVIARNLVRERLAEVRSLRSWLQEHHNTQVAKRTDPSDTSFRSWLQEYNTQVGTGTDRSDRLLGS